MPIPERDKDSKSYQTKTWWNRPVWGNKSFISTIKQKLEQAPFKAEVPDSSIAIYGNYINQMGNIAAIANSYALKNIDHVNSCSKPSLKGFSNQTLVEPSSVGR